MGSSNSKKRRRCDSIPPTVAKRTKLDPPELCFPSSKEFFESCMAQQFSLPLPLIQYILANPTSAEMYQKLIKCCKLFFLKNPTLVLYSLTYAPQNGFSCRIGNQCNRCEKCLKYGRGNIDMEKLFKKAWSSKEFLKATDQLFYGNMSCFSLDILANKIFQSDLIELRLSGRIIFYDVLKILSAGVKRCILINNAIIFNDGKEVPLEKILQLFSGAKKIFIQFDQSSWNAACESYDDFVSACHYIEEVKLSNLRRAFDVTVFYDCLKRFNNYTLIEMFYYDDPQILVPIIDDILGTHFFQFVPPLIHYPGHDHDKFGHMWVLRSGEALRYRNLQNN